MFAGMGEPLNESRPLPPDGGAWVSEACKYGSHFATLKKRLDLLEDHVLGASVRPTLMITGQRQKYGCLVTTLEPLSQASPKGPPLAKSFLV